MPVRRRFRTFVGTRTYTLTPGSVMEEMTEHAIREFWDAHPCGEKLGREPRRGLRGLLPPL